MYIINIIGGLGNQMFQYAFGYAIAQKHGQVLKLDISNFKKYTLRDYELNVFNISPVLVDKEDVERLKYKNIFEKILCKIGVKKLTTSDHYYKEPHVNFDIKVYDITGDVYFDGYWQSENYFKEYRGDLLKQFTFKENIHKQSQHYKQKIEDTESVSLHIRRGDYISNTNINSIHGTCTLGYYKDAILKIKEKVRNPHFFIFSDDIMWAKENLYFIDNITYVELTKDVPDHDEMYLMSICKHNIIANSSFSWWGAWLNENKEKIVLAPKEWFSDIKMIEQSQDIVCSDWIKI